MTYNVFGGTLNPTLLYYSLMEVIMCCNVLLLVYILVFIVAEVFQHKQGMQMCRFFLQS